MFLPASPPVAFAVLSVSFCLLCVCALTRSLFIFWQRKQATINSSLLMAVIAWDIVSLVCFSTVVIATVSKNGNHSRNGYIALHLSTAVAYVLVVFALVERLISLKKKTIVPICSTRCEICLIVTAIPVAVAVCGPILLGTKRSDSFPLVLHSCIQGILFIVILSLCVGIQTCVRHRNLSTEHSVQASAMRTTRVNAVTGVLAAVTLFALVICHTIALTNRSDPPNSIRYSLIIITLLFPACKPFIWCTVSSKFKQALLTGIDVLSLVGVPCATHAITNTITAVDEPPGGRFSYTPSTSFNATAKARTSENIANAVEVETISLRRISFNMETRAKAPRLSTVQDWWYMSSNEIDRNGISKRRSRRASWSSASTFSSFDDPYTTTEGDTKHRRILKNVPRLGTVQDWGSMSSNETGTGTNKRRSRRASWSSASSFDSTAEGDLKHRRIRKSQRRRRRSSGDTPLSSICGPQGLSSSRISIRALSAIEESEIERISKNSVQSRELQIQPEREDSSTSPPERCNVKTNLAQSQITNITRVRHLSRQEQNNLYSPNKVFGSSNLRSSNKVLSSSDVGSKNPPHGSPSSNTSLAQPNSEKRKSFDIPSICIDDTSDLSHSGSGIKELINEAFNPSEVHPLTPSKERKFSFNSSEASPITSAKEYKLSTRRDFYQRRNAIFDASCFEQLPGAVVTPTLPVHKRRFSFPPRTFRRSSSMSSLSLESIDPAASNSSYGLSPISHRRISEWSRKSAHSLRRPSSRWSLPTMPELVDVHDQYGGVFIGTYIKQ